MPDGGDAEALAQFLRIRRSRLAPGDVGLPAVGRRRTAGLRREEVAALANVSVTYYTFLEQARPVHPSPQVLEALSAALRLSAPERRYLETLANGPGVAASGWPERLDPGVAALVDRLDPFPTYVKGRRWDVLAANAAARELLDDWPASANLVHWMFTSARAREVYLEWEHEARAMLGRFRLAASRHPGDPSFTALIEELQAASGEVRDWWPRHDVAGSGNGTKKLRHPRLGPVDYNHVVLQLSGNPEQTMVTYSLTNREGTA